MGEKENKINESSERGNRNNKILLLEIVIRMICNFLFEHVTVCRSTYQGKGDNIASIKDVFKWCAGPCFSQLLGVQFQIRVLHPSFNVSWCCVRWPMRPSLLPHKFMKNWHSHGGGGGERIGKMQGFPQKVDFLKHRNSCWKPVNQILVFFLRKELFLKDLQCQDICYICALVRDNWAEVHNYVWIRASNSWWSWSAFTFF